MQPGPWSPPQAPYGQPYPQQPHPFAQQPYPAPQQQYVATGPHSGTTRMNKWLYRIFMVLFPLVGAGLGLWGATDSKVTELTYVAPLFLLPTGPFFYVWLYKMWAAIQDGQARTTPGKAVLLMFVPLFNLYWIFQVLPGYATDYNAYLDRHRVQAPKLNQGFILATMLVPFAFPISALFLPWLLIGRICDAVNALPATKA